MNAYQLEHERQVENILDWISNIGGVFQVFFFIMVLIVGGYSAFIQDRSMIHSLQVIESRDLDENKNPKFHKIQKGNIDTIFFGNSNGYNIR